MKKRIVSLLLAAVMIISFVTPTFADHESDVRSQQAVAQSALDSTMSQINVDAGISASLDAEIDDLDTQAVNLMASIDILESDIANAKSEIKKTKKLLKAANEKKDAQHEGMKARIQYLYENGQSLSFLSYLLSADDLEDFLNRVSYTQDLSQYDRDQLLVYEESIREIEKIQSDLENSKSILEEEKNNLDEQHVALESLLSEKKEQSKNYKAEVEALRVRADELSAQIAAQNAELQRIEEEGRRTRTCQSSGNLRAYMSRLADTGNHHFSFAVMDELHSTNEIGVQTRDKRHDSIRLLFETFFCFGNDRLFNHCFTILVNARVIFVHAYLVFSFWRYSV